MNNSNMNTPAFILALLFGVTVADYLGINTEPAIRVLSLLVV